MVVKFSKNGGSCHEYVNSFKNKMEFLKKHHPEVIQSYDNIPDCEFAKFLKREPSTQFQSAFFESPHYQKQFFTRLVPRDACLPGKKDLFNMCWDKEKYPDETFYVWDMNMAYTYALQKFE